MKENKNKNKNWRKQKQEATNVWENHKRGKPKQG